MSTSLQDLATLRLLLATLQLKIGSPGGKFGNPAWQPCQNGGSKHKSTRISTVHVHSRFPDPRTNRAHRFPRLYALSPAGLPSLHTPSCAGQVYALSTLRGCVTRQGTTK